MLVHLTLSQALDLFLLEDRAPSTNLTYRRVLSKALEFLGPNRDIDLVTREDILRYVQHLREKTTRYENHWRRPPEDGNLSPKTVEKRIKTLGGFFRWLQENGYIEHSPVDRLKLRRYSRPPGSSRAITPEELQAMLAVAEAKAALGNVKHLAIFLFVCDTGARAGEAANLTIGNLQIDRLGAWVLGKGDKLRPVFFGSRTAQVLQQWLEVHPAPHRTSRVFMMQSESLSQVINRLAQDAGIPHPVYAHTIRHRVGQVWSTAKMSAQATQLKLGHDNSAITIEMYYNTTWEHIQQASCDLSLAAIYGIPEEKPRLDAPMLQPPDSENKKTGTPQASRPQK